VITFKIIYGNNMKINKLSNGGELEKYPNGNKYWVLNGNYHRVDGPAIIHNNGSKFWYINGKIHREDGPAADYANGDKFWFLNGNLHREDGPAIEYTNGDKEWWLNNQHCPTEEQFLQLLKLKAFW
jgi:hypothetical protein